MNRLIFITAFIFITSMAYSQNISIIGSATPAANWYIDFNMTQDQQNPLVWTINITLTDGEVKFRQDASWDVSWGGTDFPSGNAIPGGPNIPVTAGNYDVVLNTGEPYYSFILNTTYGNVGINNESPQEKLDVNGNIRFSGELKPNGVPGTTGQMLKSNGDGTMGWAEASANSSGPVGQNGSVGYGTWGGCDMANVTEYNPVCDTSAKAFDLFGYDVSISGDFVIAGTPQDDDAAGADQGSVLFLKRNVTTGRWEQYNGKVFNPGPASGDKFGKSVYISGNYAIAGAPEDDGTAGADQGSASIFKLDTISGSWVPDGPKILNPTASAGDQFGFSVCISGEYAIIGAPYDDGPYIDQGSATIFKRNSSGVWDFVVRFYNTGAETGDAFGFSVFISGIHCIVGAPNEDEGIYGDQGSASIFRKNLSGVWEMQGSKLYDPWPNNGDAFGSAVAITDKFALVGVPYDGNTDGYGENAQGSVMVYKRNPSNGLWEYVNYLLNLNREINNNFGRNLDISGDFAMVTAVGDSEPGRISCGSATIFINNGYTFQQYQKILEPAAEPNFLGTSCGIDSATGRFVIGAGFAYNLAGKIVFGKIQ